MARDTEFATTSSDQVATHGIGNVFTDLGYPDAV